MGQNAADTHRHRPDPVCTRSRGMQISQVRHRCAAASVATGFGGLRFRGRACRRNCARATCGPAALAAHVCMRAACVCLRVTYVCVRASHECVRTAHVCMRAARVHARLYVVSSRRRRLWPSPLATDPVARRQPPGSRRPKQWLLGRARLQRRRRRAGCVWCGCWQCGRDGGGQGAARGGASHAEISMHARMLSTARSATCSKRKTHSQAPGHSTRAAQK
jgi:hypothetical protein